MYSRVEKIEDGQCFKKMGGTLAYMRISDSAANFLRLDHRYRVYGVAYNGNVSTMWRTTLVESVGISTLLDNRQIRNAWNRTFAKEGASQ